MEPQATIETVKQRKPLAEKSINIANNVVSLSKKDSASQLNESSNGIKINTGHSKAKKQHIKKAPQTNNGLSHYQTGKNFYNPFLSFLASVFIS